ncbi:glycoside hydrolase family 2 protein [Devosia sp. XJ19-1]|uniref:beta-mannosidase n=1 Tax=Devosia ureilytica TaxID=2952754 RepID=A0A9Q4AL23_9HYPH|nr:glycoside hydrolase family 2 protein [Devosia ureilytica]MCP8882542.1 glycoside hydrolase family 2 protein [Devosia ureilytica]MCP8885571.1 glycoside hydrolase family 2 protein [Devosia ureilytica]
MQRQTRPLHSGWTLHCLGGPGARPGLPEAIAASVPGTVHTDLLAAGLIPDPYLDLNEITVDWVGHCDWRYDTRFNWQDDGADHVELVFAGVDTFAVISLNGIEIGQTANMNRTYRFDVRAHLRAGENHLSVTFQSAWKRGEVLASQYEPRPNNYPGPANLMRKMACNFGWDWGPTLVTAGLWQGLALESWSKARLARVRPEITLDGADGLVRLHADIDQAETALSLKVSVAGVTEVLPVSGGAGTAELRVKSPELWWPHHLGSQKLYPLTVELLAGEELIDSWHRDIGFRSIRLDTTPDDYGSAFTLVVNDAPVYVCGANWIPDDCFLPRVTPERYAERIEQARDANINLLRVWGGGIYETDAFYDACNRAGMLVWQDFLFACAAYPEEGDLPGEIEAEARDNIVRLMPHPSLVLWNGNNENIWGWFDWGWQDVLEGRTWGQGYYLDLLPRLVAELDPTRPYWAGSPYSGTMDIHPNDPNHGCTHLWDVWNDIGYEHYSDSVPRFCSEFGWQAPPTWATLTQSVHDNPLTPTSPGVWHHQKATIGNDKLLRGLKGHLPAPQTMDDWHFATQLNQARAIHFGVAHMRSHRPRNMGAIVWQLNDCWPVTSWAAIDGYGRKKPLWYALRDVYAPHLLTIQPRNDGLAVVAVNDRTLFWRGPVTIKRMRFDGTVLAEWTHWRLCADRLSAAELAIPADLATPGNKRDELLVATMHDSMAIHYFAEDIDLELPKAAAEFALERTGEARWSLTVQALSLIKDLCVFVDRLHPDASISDMLVTLLPGQVHEFTIECVGELSLSELTQSPVLRCANDLVQAASGAGN